jgi:hypothetical protein
MGMTKAEVSALRIWFLSSEYISLRNRTEGRRPLARIWFNETLLGALARPPRQWMRISTRISQYC